MYRYVTDMSSSFPAAGAAGTTTNDEAAVVGGTGSYTGVRGTLRPENLSDSVMRLTIRLSP